MNNYYLLSWNETPELAIAIASNENILDHELIPLVEGKNYLPFDFLLKRIRANKNGIVIDDNLELLEEVWLDYQPNNMALPLMSERLKKLIESNLTGVEEVDWISCTIKKGDEEKSYFIIRFNKMFDVLDVQKTMFVQGTNHIIKPFFASSKIRYLNIFSKPSPHNLWKITSEIYISESLKKAIQVAKYTGLDFEKTSVV